MIRISPHLTFNGQCRAAFLRYQAILGGTLTTLLTYGESPAANQFDASWHELIIHATLDLGDAELMGADQTPDTYSKPQGFYIGLVLSDVDQAREVFDGLAEGGRVTMVFQSTFWSPGFGVLVDAFGIPWEVNTDPTSA
ncbi:MAG: VOC family protein [Steroidobacteraceae bacterium]